MVLLLTIVRALTQIAALARQCAIALFKPARRMRSPFAYSERAFSLRGGVATGRATLSRYNSRSGEVDEWFKSHAWKACVGLNLPRVRIPPSPPRTKSKKPPPWRFFAFSSWRRRLRAKGGHPPRSPRHAGGAHCARSPLGQGWAPPSVPPPRGGRFYLGAGGSVPFGVFMIALPHDPCAF